MARPGERPDVNDGNCSIKRCQRPVSARGLCSRHYGEAYRKGDLPSWQRPVAPGVHSLGNVDREAAVADCTVCGPGVPIRVRVRKDRKRPDSQCMTAYTKKPPWQGWENRRGNRGDRRKERLRRKYKITPDDYDRMFAEQQGRCAICRKEQPSLSVDHDHVTGAVRGLLCHRCNVALGWLNDDLDTVAQAARYLTAHAANSAVIHASLRRGVFGVPGPTLPFAPLPAA